MRKPPTPVLVLYGCTIFLSSFLLFLIQPIFAKFILPWFGGSAAVWITCLVFFQVTLLLGYLYADRVARRLRPAPQAALHIALLAAALFVLPVIPGQFWKPVGSGSDPTWRILALLTAVLGLPFLMLSATNPLLQSWYARAWPESRPYRLFALSNAGSLLALVCYPVLVEPLIATRRQDVWWSAGFAVFAACCAAAAWISRATEAVPDRGQVAAVPVSERLTWVALAAGGSMMLLATTNQLTQNVAAVPFLWILPLAVYLATFILCFESSRWYKRGVYLRILALTLSAVGYAIYDIQMGEALAVALPMFSFGLFAGCMFCHGELSARKPSPRTLTSFYLMIALGGALGAVAVGLIAPHILSGVYELPISMLCVAALALWLNRQSGWPQRMLWAVVVVAMAVVLGSQVTGYHRNALVVERSFYGTLRVIRSESAGAEVRTLYHGTIKHGAQSLDPARRMSPSTYYGSRSGVGLTLRLCCNGAKRVGVIGLGTGTVAVYGQRGDEFRFYEINPQVVELATSLFTYLRETPAHVDVTLGDARLSLQSEPPQGFDALIVDAFSGDAIPVHLLTKEAFGLYFRHLKPNGILAVHVSNQFLDLAPVTRQLAGFYKYTAIRIHNDADPERLLSATDWVLITRDQTFLQRPEVIAAAIPIAPRPGLRLWTDDYNNLFQVMKLVSVRAR